ncbi:MAG: thioredoxin family protein [Flavobacterium sp.]|nr:thioredoxin family protein [Flavobacterium sp.]
MEEILNTALNNSYSYQDYRKTVADLLQEGKTSGAIQTEALVNYSRLNETRMHRLDKTMIIDDSIISKLKAIQSYYIWLVIAEGWCGDAAQLLPIFHKMSEVSDHIDLKIVFRDDNEDLMNLFLTNGNKSIPKLIILDKNSLDLIADWGPRPKGAVELVLNYKEKFGVIDDTIKSDLQMWYLHDKGLSTQKEILELLKGS